MRFYLVCAVSERVCVCVSRKLFFLCLPYRKHTHTPCAAHSGDFGDRYDFTTYTNSYSLTHLSCVPACVIFFTWQTRNNSPTKGESIRTKIGWQQHILIEEWTRSKKKKRTIAMLDIFWGTKNESYTVYIHYPHTHKASNDELGEE